MHVPLFPLCPMISVGLPHPPGESTHALCTPTFLIPPCPTPGLFFYDIFWVFFTPVMVSVAKNFDAPIKLLFPRLGPLTAAGKRPMAMLGLGDIVIPGIFVALMLRYDVHNGFRTKYFQSCFGGYVLGLITTIVVMTYFNVSTGGEGVRRQGCEADRVGGCRGRKGGSAGGGGC